jgi:hypothetical protein
MAGTKEAKGPQTGVPQSLERHSECHGYWKASGCHYLTLCAICGASSWLKYVGLPPKCKKRWFKLSARTASYTTIWNGLDYTALVVPTGYSVDPVLDAPTPRNQFYNDEDKSIHALCKI